MLQFWDLGGQTDLRTIWPKYFADCHAVCYVIDSTDTARMDEVWSVFGASAASPPFAFSARQRVRFADDTTLATNADAAPGQIVTDDRVDGVPMLVLANKRDAPGAASVESIKEAFNKHVVRQRIGDRAHSTQVRFNVSEGAVLSISALKACGNACQA